jgi:flagellar biosynthesis/type III secretory pathway chaperone
MEMRTLANLFHEKLDRYRDLIEALKAERQCLLSGQTEELWGISSKKQQIVQHIEAIRDRILRELTEAGISYDMTVASFRASSILSLLPPAQRKPLLGTQDLLNGLKEEVQVRARENVSYVEGYLSTLDDLIRIFAQGADDCVFYDRRSQTEKPRARALLHREV